MSTVAEGRVRFDDERDDEMPGETEHSSLSGVVPGDDLDEIPGETEHSFLSGVVPGDDFDKIPGETEHSFLPGVVSDDDLDEMPGKTKHSSLAGVASGDNRLSGKTVHSFLGAASGETEQPSFSGEVTAVPVTKPSSGYITRYGRQVHLPMKLTDYELRKMAVYELKTLLCSKL